MIQDFKFGNKLLNNLANNVCCTNKEALQKRAHENFLIQRSEDLS